jgi:hypothetical protein
MARFLIHSLALVVSTAVSAVDPNVKHLAQDILTKRAALVDTHDAAAMASTFTEDAELSLVTKHKDTRTK